MEQKKLSRPNKLGELFLFQISYVLPGEYGGRHLLEACPRHVSVHALLAECDRPMPAVMCLTGCFNPRTPYGVRLFRELLFRQGFRVSIHALLAECDCARPYTLLLNRANHTLRQPP